MLCAISAYGHDLIKDATTLLSLRALAGALLYGGGFCIWIAMLRYFPLLIAFPVAAGSLILATHLIARFYLAERDRPRRQSASASSSSASSSFQLAQ